MLVVGLLGLVVSLVGGLAGCRAAPRDVGGVPDDFWLSVTVMGPVRPGPAGGQPGQPQGAEDQPSRFVVEADRVLRAATGPSAAETDFPPVLRVLSAGQVKDLHDALVRSGLPERAGIGGAGDLAVARAPTPAEVGTRRVLVISYRLDRARRTLVIDADASPDDAAKVQPALERLRALAWL